MYDSHVIKYNQFFPLLHMLVLLVHPVHSALALLFDSQAAVYCVGIS